MALTPRKLFLGLAVITVTVLLVLAFVVSLRPAHQRLPNPNGYDDFLKAASLLSGAIADAPTLDHDGLRDLVSSNTESLRLLRLGLTRRCALPAEAAMTNVPGMIAELGNLKRLAQLLAAEGRLRETDGSYLDAAMCYANTVRFGNAMSKGGFIINRLVGIACEAIGETPLSRLVPKLGPEESHRVVSELEEIDSVAITWGEVCRNENFFMRYQLYHGGSLFSLVKNLRQTLRSRERGEIRHNRVVAHRRLLIAELAARCSLSDQGQPPVALKQLVPKYLARVPLDPFSSRPLIYHPQGTNWLLYSVGQDGVDDGGKPVSKGLSGKGDIFFDSPW